MFFFVCYYSNYFTDSENCRSVEQRRSCRINNVEWKTSRSVLASKRPFRCSNCRFLFPRYQQWRCFCWCWTALTKNITHDGPSGLCHVTPLVSPLHYFFPFLGCVSCSSTPSERFCRCEFSQSCRQSVECQARLQSPCGCHSCCRKSPCQLLSCFCYR